jgi:hypothetical protein
MQSDFELPMDIIPFLPPFEAEDFDIPENWKPIVTLDYRPFKLITQNSYRGILSKPTIFGIDSQPPCNCSKEIGCSETCQNRLLYM